MSVSKYFYRYIRMKRKLLTLLFIFTILVVMNLIWYDPFYLQKHKTLKTSLPNTNLLPKHFTILIWTHGERMKRRFLRSFSKSESDPYRFCKVRNCKLVIDNAALNESDAVMFHLHQTLGPDTLPHYHPPHQYWIFFTDESPQHTFLATHKYKLEDYNGVFNWSMTYRADSDIPVPYGKTVSLSLTQNELLPLKPDYSEGKTGLVAILGSNCGGLNHRWAYVNELKKHVPVDVYGGCGKLKCAGHFTRDCLPIKNYKFYLSFENSNCREYITEKLWWNAFEKEVVPIVMGSSLNDYKRLCPPNSFLHVDSFADPKALAEQLRFLDQNVSAYNEFFKWKAKYKVLNEHGYFGSPSLHLCHICEALNYKRDHEKVYDRLDNFWSAKNDCHKPKWSPK